MSHPCADCDLMRNTIKELRDQLSKAERERDLFKQRLESADCQIARLRRMLDSKPREGAA